MSGLHQRLSEEILSHAQNLKGQTFGSGDLLPLGSRGAIDQALSRLTKAGHLVRKARGAYAIAAMRTKDGAKGASSVAWDTKYEQIIVAASELFASRGYYGVTMREIADRCDLHIATLYHYFPDKKSIYTAAVKTSWEKGARFTMDAVRADRPPRVRFELWVSDTLKFLYEDSPAARIRDREILLAGDDLLATTPKDMLALSGDIEAALIDLLIELDPPILKHVAPGRVSAMVYGMVYGIVKSRPGLRILNPERQDLDFKVIEQDVLTFIRHALGWVNET